MTRHSNELRRHLASLKYQRLEQDVQTIVDAFRGNYSESNDEQLAALIDFATHSVPYYKEYKGSVLHDFPIQDKNTMRAAGANLISDEYRGAKLARASTSGSTGTPFTVQFDNGKVGRRKAGAIANLAAAGADPFGPIVYARAWEPGNRVNYLKLRLKRHFPYAGRGSATTVEEALEWIRKHQTVALVGYASYLEDLFHEIDEKHVESLRGRVSTVIGTSELETPFLYEASRRLTSRQARMRYSNVENGVIAMTGEIEGQYLIDQSSYRIEVLDENTDRPVPPGEGGRIVITDLFNRAMPFVRYDTGDTGRFLVDSSGRVNRGVIVDLQGRRLDTLWAGTPSSPRALHPMRIWGPTASLGELRQFQLRQEDFSEFTWILNAKPSRLLERRLEEILESVLGEQVSCNFEYSSDVPVLASGKRQFFVSGIGSAGNES